jgi:chromosome segregation ATPase
MQELTTEKENLELSKKELEDKLATAEKTINDLSTEKETIENSLKEALKGADGGASTEGSPESGKSTTVGNMADDTLAGIKNLIKRRKGI